MMMATLKNVDSVFALMASMSLILKYYAKSRGRAKAKGLDSALVRNSCNSVAGNCSLDREYLYRIDQQCGDTNAFLLLGPDLARISP
jgi:hypothetical protein